jgi:predicted ATP-grasp superfamily ATP-dependent carboligase
VKIFDAAAPAEGKPPLPRHVLIAGMSTRAAAESAADAGFAVTAIDAFGDIDQHASVRSLSVRRDFGLTAGAGNIAQAATTIRECDAVAYLSNFENHPGAVRTLGAGRPIWGNTPAVLQRVRNPLLVFDALQRHGNAAPAVGAVAAAHRTSPLDGAAADDSSGGGERLPRELERGRWLVKPLASGGGHRIRRWRDGMRLRPGCYLQEFVDGTPASVVFVAAGGNAVPLGVSRQLVGERPFGAAGYRYCGSILAGAGDAQFDGDEALVRAAHALASTITEEFGLVGVNGIDFIARGGVPYAVEVNPRWSASMELVERAYNISVFGAHEAACAAGALPRFDLAQARQGAPAVGRAIVFAQRDLVLGDTRAWLPDSSGAAAAPIRDIPHPGERVAAGRPICTVFAGGRDAATCHALLVRAAERVYADVARWSPET